MTLLKMYQHHAYKYIFKFVYTHGYLCTMDTPIKESANSFILTYIKVPKGYKHETVKNI